MDVLPKVFVELDSSLKAPAGRWERYVDSDRRFSEGTWDEVIFSQADVISDALREAGVIGEDAKLKPLGRQVANVDVVFAETSRDDAEEPRRLVLVEDKLRRNPEATRSVLAQLVDYADRVQSEWSSVAALLDAFPDHEEWVQRHASTLRHSARTGDVLMVIACDGVHESLDRLARRFAAQDDPLNLSELCLLSLSLYSKRDQGGFLFVPHVVSAVQRHQRAMTLEVRFLDAGNKAVPVSVAIVNQEAEGTAGSPETREDVSRFLKAVQNRVEPTVRRMELGISIPKAKRPRKQLAFWLDREGLGWVGFHVRAGYGADWSPIHVEAELTANDSDIRDHWRSCFEEMIRAGALPADTEICAAGPRMVTAVRRHAWEKSEDLSDALVETVSASFLQMLEGLARRFAG